MSNLLKSPDAYPPPKSTSQAILWFLLSFSVMVIVGMAASWAHGVEARQIATDQRLNIVEQNYGTVVAQLQYLREQNKEMSDKLDKILEKR